MMEQERRLVQAVQCECGQTFERMGNEDRNVFIDQLVTQLIESYIEQTHAA